MQLEEDNGKVSKGLTPAQIRAIPTKMWRQKKDFKCPSDQCTICYENFKRLDSVKEMKKCGHGFHTKCIDKWLKSEKRCPVCNTDVI